MSERGAQRSGINKSLMWLRKVLRVTEPTDTPDRISPLLQPTIDVFGWDFPVTQLEQSITQAAGATTVTRLPTPPDGEAHYYVACDIFHDEAAVTQVVAINIENQANLQVAVSPSAGAGTGASVSLTRPFLVPAGSQLMGVSIAAIPAGSVFTIRGMFIRLDAGEYFGASPFG